MHMHAHTHTHTHTQIQILKSTHVTVPGQNKLSAHLEERVHGLDVPVRGGREFLAQLRDATAQLLAEVIVCVRACVSECVSV
jgi:hypothetical protein